MMIEFLLKTEVKVLCFEIKKSRAVEDSDDNPGDLDVGIKSSSVFNSEN